jgi:hypothetical protein
MRLSFHDHVRKTAIICKCLCTVMNRNTRGTTNKLGAPTVGLMSWDCEVGHDDECNEIGRPGYSLMPACARCLQNPNRNDLDQHAQ